MCSVRKIGADLQRANDRAHGLPAASAIDFPSKALTLASERMGWILALALARAESPPPSWSALVLGSGSGSGISLGAGPIKVARTYNSTIVVLFIADADCFNCSVPFVRVSRVLCSLHSTAGFKKIRSKKNSSGGLNKCASSVCDLVLAETLILVESTGDLKIFRAKKNTSNLSQMNSKASAVASDIL